MISEPGETEVHSLTPAELVDQGVESSQTALGQTQEMHGAYRKIRHTHIPQE